MSVHGWLLNSACFKRRREPAASVRLRVTDSRQAAGSHATRTRKNRLSRTALILIPLPGNTLKALASFLQPPCPLEIRGNHSRLSRCTTRTVSPSPNPPNNASIVERLIGLRSEPKSMTLRATYRPLATQPAHGMYRNVDQTGVANFSSLGAYSIRNKRTFNDSVVCARSGRVLGTNAADNEPWDGRHRAR